MSRWGRSDPFTVLMILKYPNMSNILVNALAGQCPAFCVIEDFFAFTGKESSDRGYRYKMNFC